MERWSDCVYVATGEDDTARGEDEDQPERSFFHPSTTTCFGERRGGELPGDGSRVGVADCVGVAAFFGLLFFGLLFFGLGGFEWLPPIVRVAWRVVVVA